MDTLRFKSFSSAIVSRLDLARREHSHQLLGLLLAGHRPLWGLVTVRRGYVRQQHVGRGGLTPDLAEVVVVRPSHRAFDLVPLRQVGEPSRYEPCDESVVVSVEPL